MSAREEAVDAILAACKIIPCLTDMKFSGAASDTHASINRCHVGVVHSTLGHELAEWRPSQVSDFCRIAGAARYAPGQKEEAVLQEIHAAIEKAVRRKTPGLSFKVRKEDKPGMPAFEVSPNSRVVWALNAAYSGFRREPQPTGALQPTCFYGSYSGHLYEKLGMEGIVCGPGGKYNTRPDEKVDIVDFLDYVKMFVRLIVEICG